MQGLIAKLFFHPCHNYKWPLPKAVTKQGLPVVPDVAQRTSFEILEEFVLHQ